MAYVKIAILTILALSIIGCQATGTPATTPVPHPQPSVPVVVGTPVPPDYEVLNAWGLEPETTITVIPLPSSCIDGGEAALAMAVAYRSVTLENVVPSGLSPEKACMAYVGHQLLRRAFMVPLLYEGVTKLVETGPELMSFDGTHGAAMVKTGGKILVYLFGSASLLTSFDTTAAKVSTLLPKNVRLAKEPEALASLFKCMKDAFEKIKDPVQAKAAQELAESLYKDNKPSVKFSPLPVAVPLESLAMEIPSTNRTMETSEYALSVPLEFSSMSADEVAALIVLGVLVVTAVVVFTCVTTGCTTLLILAPAALGV